MNVFRSLAHSILKAIGFRRQSEEEQGDSTEAAPKKERAASRPTFSPPARGDGFDAGARNKPVDLSGGVKLQFAAIEEPVAEARAPAESDFEASLDDLGTLMEAQAAEQPDPSGFAADPQDVFEPVDSFEYPAPVVAELPVAAAELPVAAAELPVAPAELPPAIAELPVTVEPVTPPDEAPQPVVVEQPMVAAAVTAPSPVTPQYTVQLLMPVDPERAVQPRAAEQFSTLELIDTVAQLTGDEPAVGKEEEPATEPEPSPELLPPGA